MKKKQPIESYREPLILNKDKNGKFKIPKDFFGDTVVEEISADIPDGIAIAVSDPSLPANQLVETSDRISIVFDTVLAMRLSSIYTMFPW